MANPRIEDLRRRVDKDPASIAFAQLAEEYRRTGDLQQAIEVARAGLDVHPGYLSARVTLARALVERGNIDDAQREFETVLKAAPDNLAAIRGLAEIHHRETLVPDTHPGFAAHALEPSGEADVVASPRAGAVSERPAERSEEEGWVDLSFAAVEPITEAAPAPVVAALEQFLAAIHVARAERHS
jgi:tetratricopeptide (TPR) repeat protein